ncbi:PfaD family polyunsaturated fatty acid/polyketide biosynthesis protein [Actinomyces sp. 2119]|uniref:PfaD family polyunsaturated fatty acid/polyketide biosynthesis protein n=1 Tax=Actinomyces sp. 2119 TaxID=2321393 RepID=UPI000E6D2D92|nr:PfaD family polyunsaturated fatty acid/polyketide biosynthesis protein [Actinomyces sp. 2119]RJF41184.1 PfaD family polyunsaturated fatty acid/polyketide biosynthesis protein [Actinomyces sp. 2119]
MDVAVDAHALGSEGFRRRYGVRLAYVAGSMYRGISSPDMVVRMGEAGLLAFLGTGGLASARLTRAVDDVCQRLGGRGVFGLNLLAAPSRPVDEEAVVDLCLARDISAVETSAFVTVTPPMVRYRLQGVREGRDGEVVAPRRIMAKVSRPEVARLFLGPPPEPIVRQLRETGRITEDEARLARRVTMADSITVEADSGGHTDQRSALTLLPDILRLRDETQSQVPSGRRVSIGAAGGLGTPESVAAVFLIGADYVLTGSVNQCTVEAGTSELVKEMLQGVGTADTAMAPAGDMFQEGAKVQVVGRGTLFAPRGRKLYELYHQHASWEELVRSDPRVARQIEERYFGRGFEEVWQETRAYYGARYPEEVERAERQPRRKLALVFRRYFSLSSRWAQEGKESQRVNFQIQCGPALGAWNRCVRGTALEPWRSRHVDQVADVLMGGAADLLSATVGRYASRTSPLPATVPAGSSTGRQS